MRRVQVIVPAAATGLGSGLGSLGLALTLHNTIEAMLRADWRQHVHVTGECAFPASLDHPAMRAVAALFKVADKPMPGIDLFCQGNIPADAGLGDSATWTIGGLFAANNLLDAPMRRERIAELAFTLSDRTAELATALSGSLTLAAPRDETAPLAYRRVELERSFDVVLLVPRLPAYREKTKAGSVTKHTLQEITVALGRSLLTAEALRRGDLDLLATALHDRVRPSRWYTHIPGYERMVEAVKPLGGLAVALSGDGPALLVFGKAGHQKVADMARACFAEAGVDATAWVLNVDTQGVAINAQR